MENSKDNLIGSRRTRIYHDPLCRDVDDITDETEVWFVNAGHAEAEGYEACQRCNPARSSDDDLVALPMFDQFELVGNDYRPRTTSAEHNPDAFFYDCPQCGEKVQDDFRKCPYCGEALFEDVV